MTSTTPSVIVLMGVSGAGKTTVGLPLAERLGWEFADADDFHTPANKAKMASGLPLDDEERQPWLKTLHDLVVEKLEHDSGLVLACSALKRTYRNLIAGNDPRVQFVFLSGSFELIQQRLQARHGHYMPAALLRSQFAALEAPPNALTLDVGVPPQMLVKAIVEWLNEGFQRGA